MATIKTVHSKMTFWGSLKKYSCFRLSGEKGIDGLKSVAYTANSFIRALY